MDRDGCINYVEFCRAMNMIKQAQQEGGVNVMHSLPRMPTQPSQQVRGVASS